MSNDNEGRFDCPSLDLLRRAVVRAEVNPHFALRFVEEAARLARADRRLHAALTAGLHTKGGPRPTWSLSEKRLLVDKYDFDRSRGYSADVAYEKLSEHWSAHSVSYWRKLVSEFRADIRRHDNHE